MSGVRRLPSSVPVIETQRLLLRAVDSADIGALKAIYGDPEVMRYASSPAFTHEGEYARTVASMHRYLVNDQAIEWGMVRKSSGAVVGLIGLHNFKERQAEIGCLLARVDWGQGLMREAILAVMDFAPGVGLARLDAEIDAGNARSEQLFAGLGFVADDVKVQYQPTMWTKVVTSPRPRGIARNRL